MAQSKGANTYNRQNWEDSSFPILCETCLGPSPFVRMIKDKYGKECKICERPFTIFRWSPGPKARFKKTEVCQSCAKVKNVCQTCLFDLEYGLPVEVRDKALRLSQQLPKNDVNREYFHQQVEHNLEIDGDVTAPYGGNQLIGKMLSNTASASSSSGGGGTDLLLKLARTAPYYRRNRPHICSFWVKGECRRGEECPYRHEKPTDPDDPLSDQNMRDRYFGQDDPVAAKLLSKYDSMPKLLAPEDRTITTLYIGSIPSEMTEKDLHNHFYQFGELRSVSLHSKQHCAFIQFATRSAAERAADRSYDRLILGGHRLTVNWGKSPAALAAANAQPSYDASDHCLPPVPGLPLPPMMPPPNILGKMSSIVGGLNNNFFLTPPPPPPPLPSSVSGKLPSNTTSNINTGKLKIPPPPPLPNAIQIAPPVIDALPSGNVLLRGPTPLPLLSTPTVNQLSNASIPLPVGIESDQNANTSGQSIRKGDKTKLDNGHLDIHYPSQNP